jgi:hypothetical protein
VSGSSLGAFLGLRFVGVVMVTPWKVVSARYPCGSIVPASRGRDTARGEQWLDGSLVFMFNAGTEDTLTSADGLAR